MVNRFGFIVMGSCGSCWGNDNNINKYFKNIGFCGINFGKLPA